MAYLFGQFGGLASRPQCVETPKYERHFEGQISDSTPSGQRFTIDPEHLEEYGRGLRRIRGNQHTLASRGSLASV
jgi:hypothetical protein